MVTTTTTTVSRHIVDQMKQEEEEEQDDGHGKWGRKHAEGMPGSKGASVGNKALKKERMV